MILVLLSLNALIMISIPIMLGIWLARRFHTGWLIFLIGSAGFIAAQILHIPFNHYALNPFIKATFGDSSSVLSSLLIGVLLGLSAGVFEEGMRYGIYRWRSGMRSWESGMMFGTGWGGAEAIIAGVLAASTLINVYIYQSGMLESLLPADQLAANPDLLSATAAQMEALINHPPWYFLLGAVERLLAITLQLSLSLLVLQAFVRHNIIWLVLAILWHTAADTVAVFGSLQKWNPLFIELALAVFAAASLLIIIRLRTQPESALSDVQEPTATDV